MTHLDAPIVSPIVSVTVFPDRARITRRGLVTVAEGEQKITLGPLPLSLPARLGARRRARRGHGAGRRHRDPPAATQRRRRRRRDRGTVARD
jgi:hypothetical protein